MAADASATVEAGSRSSDVTAIEELDTRCARDARGNWVCLWPIGAFGSAGPCAIGPDHSLHVASQRPPREGTGEPMYAQLTQFRESGALAWSRDWHGSRAQSLIGPRISALAVDANGVVFWGGEECEPDAQRPRATPSSGYYDSCLDARLVALESNGKIRWSWSFGTSTGLERISDIALAPQGLYLAGPYHPPLIVPNQQPIPSQGGQDLYVMNFLDPDHIAWVRTWGTAAHDGNDLRIASTDSGLVVTGHLGITPSSPGFYTRLRNDGSVQWQVEAADTYIADIAPSADDLAYTTPGLARMNGSGERTKLQAPPGLGLGKIRDTEKGTLVLTSQDADHIVEVDRSGKPLREHVFEAAQSLWYQGGACVYSDMVAVSGHVEHASDFGILSSPLPVPERSAFILFLRDW